MDLRELTNTPPWEWPDNAGEFLTQILKNPESKLSERLVASELVGSEVVMNDEVADLLLNIIQNEAEPEELRCECAISLGPALEYSDTMEFEDLEDIMLTEKKFLEVQKVLQLVYQEASVPLDVRRRVLEASVRAPQDWHEKAVRAAYYSDDDDWRLTAVFCMNYIRGFEDEIMAALDSEDKDIVCEAVCAAGNWGLEQAWGFVADLILQEDVDKHLLLAAINAVAAIHPEEAIDLLSDLANSEDEEIAYAVEEALALHGILSDDLSPDDGD